MNLQHALGRRDSTQKCLPRRDRLEEQIQKLIEQAKTDHGVDLEIDKTYRYCVLSNRKKNYLGVTDSGKVDVKGLTGKKSQIR